MLPFREVWCIDFEFRADPGERPDPICLVAREVRSGRLIRLWRDRFGSTPPFSTDEGSLIIAYFATAEMGCFRARGWPMPRRLLDLYVEFRNRTNGLTLPAGRGLLGALTYFGLDAMGAGEKKAMIDLILSDGSRSKSERLAILDYCQEDVDALCRLLPAMLSGIDLPRALLRGRY